MNHVSWRNRLQAATFTALVFGMPILSHASSFQGLGTLNPQEGFYSTAYDVSPDGQYVVGQTLQTFASQNSPTFTTYRWSAQQGMLPVNNDYSLSFVASPQVIKWAADGDLLGRRIASLPGGSTVWNIGRWDPVFGWFNVQSLPPNIAYLDFTPDTNTAAAWQDSKPIVWTPGGIQPLPLPTYTVIEFGIPKQRSYAPYFTHFISDDASVITGSLFGQGAPDLQGFWRNGQWTTINGMSFIYRLSADGNVILGRDDAYSNTTRWSQSDGLIPLGFYALDLSANGQTIIGSTSIWDPVNGKRDLFEMLQNDHALNLSGWTSLSAQGISDDGLTIVGNGVNPQGLNEAWIAQIPEPGTLGLMALGMVFLAWRCGRRKNGG
jgi:PEP-CTERM motif-containing protein